MPSYANMATVGGGMPLDLTGDYALGYASEETVQRADYGARVITNDGRVFKYCKAKAAVKSGFGAANDAPQNISDATVTAAVGDLEVGVTIAAGDGAAADGAIAENELRGGYFVAGHGATAAVQNRMIEKNTLVAAGGAECTLTLDFPIADALAAAFCELVLNPYRYLSNGALEYNAFMCVPAVNADAAENFWGQTWGPCWVVPGGGDNTPGDSVDDRMVYFVGDGSVNGGTAIDEERGHQVAGFIIDETGIGTGALPLVMLQISI